MKNVVGQVAAKENFYNRPREIARIKRNLEAGANIQLASPRRVGKSSILQYFLDNPIDGFIFIYKDVESARTKQGFYEKIYSECIRNKVLLEKRGLWKQLTEGINAGLRKLKSLKLGPLGEITLAHDVEVDYEEELLNFLEGIDIGENKLVIMIDEFPEVLLNMVEDEAGNHKTARSFLQSNREFRNNRAIHGKVQFIYTGSNSLNGTVTELKSTELINDLPSMPVNPLHEPEAMEMIQNIMAGYGFGISDEMLKYMIRQVEWLIPFYFQLVIQELLDLLDEGEEITEQRIDKAIEQIALPRNDNHFQHYMTRLNRVFGQGRTDFIRKTLNRLVEAKELTKSQIIDFGHGGLSEHQVKVLLDSLLVDGYLVKTSDDTETYKFNSPILANWWARKKD